MKSIYRKRATEVEVFHVTSLTTEIAEIVSAWCPFAYIRPADNHLVLATKDGDVTVSRGDYIVKNKWGVYKAMDEATFRDNYEEVN